MRATASLIRREIGAYFLSPIAYVVIFAFLFVTGALFTVTMDQLTTRGPKGVEFPLQVILGDRQFWVVFLFIPALLTMRLFAEENSTGTLEMLMTAPLRDWQVVLSKYAASFVFYLLMWLPTLLYLPILLRAQTAEGRVDAMPVFSAILGLVLVGGMFLALGLFISSLVRSQLVAALVSLCVSLVFVVGAFWRVDVDLDSAGILSRLWYHLSNYVSVPLHFNQDFSRGIVDTRHVILYLSVTLFCLFLTVRSLESRRWR
jgi:ABC-2 type transport system permease protein